VGSLGILVHNTCGSDSLGGVPDNSLRRNITNTSELDKNMLNGLNNEGTTNLSGGRSGGNRPLTGKPNSYQTTSAGHKLVYDSDGLLSFDINSYRVKMTIWDQSPNGQLFPRDIKLKGKVPKEFL
jgi:hypothetical protein